MKTVSNIKPASQNPLYSEVSIQRSIGAEDPYSSIYESVIQGTADFLDESNKLQVDEDLKYLDCYNLLDECVRNNIFEAQYQYELENNFNPDVDINDVYVSEAADRGNGINPNYDLPGYILTGGPLGKIFKLLRNLALATIGLAGYGLYRALRGGDAKKTVGRLNDIVSQGVFGTGRKPVNTQDGKDASEKVNNPKNYDKISEIAEDPNAKKRQIDRLSGSYAGILRDSYNDLRNNIIAIHEAVYGTDHYDLIPANLFPKKYKPNKKKEGIIRYIPDLDNTDGDGDNEAIAARVYCNFKDYLLTDIRPDTTMSLVVHPSVFLNIIATLQSISKKGYPSYKKAAERYFNILKGINSREVISPSTKLDGVLVCSSEDKLEGSDKENTYSLYNYLLRNPDTVCYIPNIPDAQLRNILQTYNNYVRLYTGTDIDEKIKDYLKSKAVDRYNHYANITRVSNDDFDTALDSNRRDFSRGGNSDIASDTIRLNNSAKENYITRLNESSESEDLEQKIVEATHKLESSLSRSLSEVASRSSDEDSGTFGFGEKVIQDLETVIDSLSQSIVVEGKSSNARKITRRVCLTSLFVGLPDSNSDNIDLTNYHRVDVVNTHIEASNILTPRERECVKSICRDLVDSSNADVALTTVVVDCVKKLKKSARRNDKYANLLTQLNYYVRLKYFSSVLEDRDISDNFAVKKEILNGLFDTTELVKADLNNPDDIQLPGGGSYITVLEGLKKGDKPDAILGASGHTFMAREIGQGDDMMSLYNKNTSVNDIVQNTVFNELDTSKTDFTTNLKRKFNNIKNANAKACEAAIAQFENKKTRGPLSYMKKDKGRPSDASRDVKSMKAASKIRSIWAQKELLFDDAADRYVEKFYSSETYLDSIKYINLRIKPYIKIFLHILDENLMRDIEKTAFNNIDIADISHLYPIPECLYFGVPSNPNLIVDYDNMDLKARRKNKKDKKAQHKTSKNKGADQSDTPFNPSDVEDVKADIPTNADGISFDTAFFDGLPEIDDTMQQDFNTSDEVAQ